MKARVIYAHEMGPANNKEAIERWQNEKRDYAEGVEGARRWPCGYREVGDVVDHPDCWMNCILGQMEPADDECLKKVGAHFKRKGIHYDEEFQARQLERYAAQTEMRLTGDPTIDAPKQAENEGEREEAESDDE